MRIRVLGPVEVVGEEGELRPLAPKPRTLLALLACTRRGRSASTSRRVRKRNSTSPAAAPSSTHRRSTAGTAELARHRTRPILIVP